MTTTPQSAAYAVMEDDTVLCADCLPEICDDRLPATAASMVHAWIIPTPGLTCRCCNTSPEPIGER
jgi:hypothetical protein